VARVLIAEDEPTFRDLLADILESAGHSVVAVGDGEAALAAVQHGGFELLITDRRMPRLGGLELLQRMRALPAAPPAIVLTAHGTIPEAVEAVRLGAADYLTKPLASPRALLAVVERILAPETESREFVTVEPAVTRLLELVDRIAGRDISVLVTGETGSGKELVARRLHRGSTRAEGPFVAVNCAAFPESLAESELFGHERGAYTGAERQRPGRFEEASGGTLFLDEVGELAPPLQAKLLRVLEERRLRRLGGSEDIAVDVRVVAATNRDLEAEAERGGFRRDLYFRLAVVRVDLPPLRERPRDIPVLAAYLLRQLAARHGGARIELGAGAVAALERHSWPGNVRELRNVLERAAVVRGEGVIAAEDLGLREDAPAVEAVPLDRDGREREAVLEALRRSGGNRDAAARLLGVSVRTLYYRLQRYGIA
jgi:DNA-binding NtrC family response regulator